MRLTVTQRKILQRAINSHCGVVAVHSGFITSRRRKSYGTREREAARMLREFDLLIHIRTNSGINHLSHGFGSDHYSEAVYEITEKGRKIFEK